jgi:hypothetical protein
MVQHYKSLLIWCCDGVQFAVVVSSLWLMYHGPSHDDTTKARMKRFALVAFSVFLISWVVEVIIERTF